MWPDSGGGPREAGAGLGRSAFPRVLLALALLLAACARTEKPRHLLLVTLDTTRADRLGAYGGSPDVSPTFDALAREGALFERAYAPVPCTLPSHSTLLSGLEPPRHGVRMNGRILPEDVRTLTQRLSGAGFVTGAVIGSSVLDSTAGLSRGFDSYDAPSVRAQGAESRTAEEGARRALAWLAGLPSGRRFFLWVHFFDPHDPYEPPPPWDARFPGRAYEGEIACADEGIGRLLRALRESGRLAETLVCVAADHGESLGEHGEPTHGLFLYESTMRVPLLLHHAATVPAVRVEGVARLADVSPTLLDLLGLPPLGEVDGRSLVQSLRAGRVDPERPAYLESEVLFPFGGAPLYGLRTEEWKFVRAPRPELYRPEEDPGESTNLVERHPQAAAGLDRQLTEIARRLASGARTALEDHRQDSALAALGYLAHSQPEGSFDGLDPKDYYPLRAAVDRAVAAIRSGTPDEEVLAAIEREFPDATNRACAAFHVGAGLFFAERFDAALAWAERARRLRPAFAAAAVLEAHAAAAKGDVGRAEAVLRETLRASPRYTDAQLGLARLLVHQRRGAEAEPLLAEIVRERPNAYSGWELLGRILAEDPARRSEAISALEHAVRFSPEPGPSLSLLRALTGAASAEPAPLR